MKFDNLGWLDIAQEYNISGNSFDRGGIVISHLVIHGTAGGTNGGDTMAYMGNNGVSTHFAISTDGAIYQGIPVSLAAWANAPLKDPRLNFARADINPNLWTVSIEFCKPDVNNAVDITDAQKTSGFALINFTCDTYSIAKKPGDGNGGIISHADINSIDRAHCPGVFPWDDLWTYLNGGSSMSGVPNGWHDDGEVLTAPNGVQVTQGFRQWVLSHNWDSNNVPRLTALGSNPVEQGNPGLGAGTVQPFTTNILAWTPQKGVYEMYAGQEFIALHQVWNKSLSDLRAAQAQIVSLEAQLTQSQSPAVKDLQSRLTQAYNLSTQITQIVRLPS